MLNTPGNSNYFVSEKENNLPRQLLNTVYVHVPLTDTGKNAETVWAI